MEKLRPYNGICKTSKEIYEKRKRKKKLEKCDDIGSENSGGTAIIRSVAISHSDRIVGSAFYPTVYNYGIPASFESSDNSCLRIFILRIRFREPKNYMSASLWVNFAVYTETICELRNISTRLSRFIREIVLSCVIKRGFLLMRFTNSVIMVSFPIADTTFYNNLSTVIVQFQAMKFD